MPATFPNPALTTAYQAPPDVYDEAFENSLPRSHWKEFLKNLNQMGFAELAKRTQQADAWLEENGVTFGAFVDQSTRERPWQLDLIPYIIDEETWATIEQGVDQRARVFDALIKDLHGEQSVLRKGILPAEALYAHPGFLRSAVGIHRQADRSLIVYAAELARSENGRFWVMADRSNAPVGAGFALENRIITKRTIPHLSQSVHIRQLAPYFVKLKETLKQMSPQQVAHPRIAILTSGPRDKYYFEDVYLARYLGYDLAQGSDLAVRDNQVYLKTLAGLLQVNVILARGNEAGLDPVELGGGSAHGVPGLLNVIRSGNVAIANRPGSGIIESPLFMSLLGPVCQHFLGESLKLPSIATWWCQKKDELDYVLNHLDTLVIKPAFSASGGEEIQGNTLSQTQKAELKQRILDKPFAFVAQESVARSAVPTVSDNQTVKPGHCAIRAFAVSHQKNYSIMPGGLVRVSRTFGPMELSISGGETSKDLWVSSNQPIVPVSLLPEKHRNVPLKRTSAMFPSRVADDLFWLGLSIERTDLLARFLRSLSFRINNESEKYGEDTMALIRGLVSLGMFEPGFVISDIATTLPKLSESLISLVLNTETHNGLAGAAQEVIRLSGLVRDWISPETWQQLNKAGGEFLNLNNATEKESVDSSILADALDDLVLTLASAMGLIDNGMIRGPAWRFLDLGRRIERARTSVTFFLSLLESKTYHNTSTLRMMLEVFDCQMTYRARYLDDIQPNAVFDLCLTDSTNPRSVDSQLTLISEHVDTLPDHDPDPLRNEDKRLAMSAVHQVRMLTSEDLGALTPTQLVESLTLIDKRLRDLAALLERKYLLHSGEPRQIVGPGGVVS